jgi:hypothetical protein
MINQLAHGVFTLDVKHRFFPNGIFGRLRLFSKNVFHFLFFKHICRCDKYIYASANTTTILHYDFQLQRGQFFLQLNFGLTARAGGCYDDGVRFQLFVGQTRVLDHLHQIRSMTNREFFLDVNAANNTLRLTIDGNAAHGCDETEVRLIVSRIDTSLTTVSSGVETTRLTSLVPQTTPSSTVETTLSSSSNTTTTTISTTTTITQQSTSTIDSLSTTFQAIDGEPTSSTQTTLYIFIGVGVAVVCLLFVVAFVVWKLMINNGEEEEEDVVASGEE